jgi:hypothetical protein
MSETPRLGLPEIAAAQAQKHITHNDALARLDVVVQMVVQDASRSVAPEGPADGHLHIVSTAATGAWQGKDHQIALWRDNGWTFLEPSAGWLCYDLETTALLAFDGAEWQSQSSGGLAAETDRLGIATTPDDINRLAVSSPAILQSAVNAADGGSGDARFIISKETIADNASVLFQTGFSGRAEFGLTGGDAFALKVSPDNSAWTNSFSIDPVTAVADFAFPPARDGHVIPDAGVLVETELDDAALGDHLIWIRTSDGHPRRITAGNLASQLSGGGLATKARCDAARMAWRSTHEILAEPDQDPDGLDVTANGVRWAFGPDGTLRPAESGRLRDHYDPATGEYLGKLIEPEERTNLCPWSQAFEAWQALELASIQDNYGLAPDGSHTAARLCVNTTNDTHVVLQSISFTSGQTYCLSVFVKALTGRYAVVGLPPAAFGATIRATVDLQDGALSTDSDGSAGVQSLKNGWYRVWVSATATATASAQVLIGINNTDDTSLAHTGNGTDDILVWGAQPEQGSFPSSYIPAFGSAATRPAESVTEAILGYTGGPDGTPGSNLLSDLEALDQTVSWTQTNIGNITANATAAPLGAGAVADEIFDDATDDVHRLEQFKTITADADMAFSVFCKPATLDHVRLDLTDGGSNFLIATFDLANGVPEAEFSGGTAVLHSVRVIDYPDGWKRVALIGNLGGGITSARARVLLHNGSSHIYSGAGESLYAWGAKLEEGSALTPYNAADTAHWFNPNEGTILVEIGTPYRLEPNFARLLNFSDGTFDHVYEIISPAAAGGDAIVRARVDNSGVAQFNDLTGAANGGLSRIALSYADNDYAVCADGAAVISDTIGSVPRGISLLRFGQSGVGGTPQAILLRRFRYFPNRLTGAQLQSLTRA